MTITCTRPSTTASSLDDKGGLFAFIAATTVQTVFRNRDLRNQAALVDSDDWRAYKPLYQEADRRRGKPEAGHGTAIHGALNALHLGRPVSGLDDDVVRDAQAAIDALERLGLTIVASEENIVCLDLPEPHAGTRDILAADDSGRHTVVDLKTANSLGGARYKALSWSVQLAIYAHGRPYGEDEFARDGYDRPLVEEDAILLEERDVNLDEAIVIEVERGTGRVEVHTLDIAQGWAYADLACRVRAARKSRLIRSTPVPRAVWTDSSGRTEVIRSHDLARRPAGGA